MHTPREWWEHRQHIKHVRDPWHAGKEAWQFRAAWGAATLAVGTMVYFGAQSVWATSHPPESQWPSPTPIEQSATPSPAQLNLPPSYEPAPLVTIHVPR